MTTFKELQLHNTITENLAKLGYSSPTPIQEKSIPHLLQGKDVFGCAQTGTGKTAAFALPILNKLASEKKTGNIRALILAPTRELASQIGESFHNYSKGLGLKHLVIFGGVSQMAQVRSLKAGVDILIATPGRLLDLMNQRYISIGNVDTFVLDEADRMLDMGFIPDIKRIISKLPAKKQVVLFSATVPPEIKSLTDSLLNSPEVISTAPVSTASQNISQSLYYVDRTNRENLLKHIIEDMDIQQALVFTRTKHGADKVVKNLVKAGISAEAIHGNKSQNARERALGNFRRKKVSILVATDIASRGIDIEKLPHVINFELPEQAETYIHRIGRTGRAGESGSAISFCTSEERGKLKEINRLLKKDIVVVEEHPYHVKSSGLIGRSERSSAPQRRSWFRRK